MISFSEVPGLEVSPFLLLFIGLSVGIVAGFIGVGGGFMITPALIVLGFPASAAVGTGLAMIAGSSVAAAMRHGQLGNIDVKLALVMLAGTLAGAEAGVRLVNWLKEEGVAEEGVLFVSLLVMGLISGYTAWESRRARRVLEREANSGGGGGRDVVVFGAGLRVQSFHLPPMLTLPRSRVRISLWVLVAIGFVAGLLAGLIGVGGGFITAPALIYLVGIPSHITIGTGLLWIVFTAGYGTIRHTMSDNVLIFASFLMLLGAAPGTQIGAIATRYVTGPAVRLVLAAAVGAAALGTGLELADVIAKGVDILQLFAQMMLFGAMGFLSIVVVALLVLGIRYQRGRSIPSWAESLCCKQ